MCAARPGCKTQVKIERSASQSLAISFRINTLRYAVPERAAFGLPLRPRLPLSPPSLADNVADTPTRRLLRGILGAAGADAPCLEWPGAAWPSTGCCKAAPLTCLLTLDWLGDWLPQPIASNQQVFCNQPGVAGNGLPPRDNTVDYGVRHSIRAVAGACWRAAAALATAMHGTCATAMRPAA
jgi:hypothetical protein